MVFTFSEASYDLRLSYLSVKKDRVSDLTYKLFFKTRNPVFNGVHLRKSFLSHLCTDFDIMVCYKAMPSLSVKTFRAT